MKGSINFPFKKPIIVQFCFKFLVHLNLIIILWNRFTFIHEETETQGG